MLPLWGDTRTGCILFYDGGTGKAEGMTERIPPPTSTAAPEAL